MGERIFRPGIRTSDKVAANIREGGWIAQVFYDWLLTVVDDYGRYDARPSVLRAEIFPLLLDLVREADVSRCLQSCAASGLIRLYKHVGKEYLEVTNWKQRLRAQTSRWPAPSGHCPDNGVTMPTDTETDTETSTETEKEASASCPEPDKPARVLPPEPPPVLVFPVNARAGSPREWGLTAECLAELGETFPGLDVKAEAVKSLGWIKANPEKRKTAKGMRRFLFGWMERAPRRGPSVPANGHAPKTDFAAAIARMSAKENK